jgi:hypothetical protein
VKYVTYPVVAGLMALAYSSAPGASAQQVDPHLFVPPAVFQAAGPNTASIQGTVDQFRAALGAVNNGNAPGPLAGGRREINWDGGGSTATSPGPTPFTVFLNTRGALMTTPGTGFVQAPVDGLVTTFGNPTYATIFSFFSPVRLFSPIDSNITDVDFFIPGTAGNTHAATTGFGAVFTDVDQPDGGRRRPSTFVEYYDAAGNLIFSSAVPPSPGNGTLSFFGAIFTDARIAKVRIRTGDVALGPDDDRFADVVVMDDFIYGEPKVF